jgi:hypothetical protein
VGLPGLTARLADLKGAFGSAPRASEWLQRLATYQWTRMRSRRSGCRSCRTDSTPASKPVLATPRLKKRLADLQAAGSVRVGTEGLKVAPGGWCMTRMREVGGAAVAAAALSRRPQPSSDQSSPGDGAHEPAVP